MKYGFVIPGGDVAVLVEIAQEVEEAGCDAVFVADGVYGTDPWISLAAIAVRTERVRNRNVTDTAVAAAALEAGQ